MNGAQLVVSFALIGHYPRSWPLSESAAGIETHRVTILWRFPVSVFRGNLGLICSLGQTAIMGVSRDENSGAGSAATMRRMDASSAKDATAESNPAMTTTIAAESSKGK